MYGMDAALKEQSLQSGERKIVERIHGLSRQCYIQPRLRKSVDRKFGSSGKCILGIHRVGAYSLLP